MKKACHQDLQRQIANLIPLVEMSIPLIEEIDHSKNKLNSLPGELNSLKRQLKLLQLKSSASNDLTASDNVALPSHLETTNQSVDSLVDNLDEILIHLATFDRQIRNVVVLKERLEAIQEQRIGDLTAAQYKLPARLEDRPRHPLDSSTTRTITFKGMWRKIVNYRYAKKIAMSTVALSGVVFLSAVAYSSMNQQAIDNNTVEQIKE